MLEISKKTNLLEESFYRYELQDVEKPNLFDEIYNYNEIPKIPFNHRVVPIDMPENIRITDTSFRDGMQSLAPYSIEEMVDIYKLIAKLGGPNGIISQTEFFVYSEKDREAIRRCQDLGLKFPEITTWIRAVKSDFSLVKNLGIKETGILVSASDYHIFNKLGLTRKQALDKYLGTVKDALDAGIKPRCHFEDITRADFYGFVVPFANELQKLSKETGIPIKIRACDTMGYGVPFTHVALPRSVAGIIYGLREYADVSSENLEWHGHNDFYMGVANATTAWIYGAGAVNCSLLGIGERTGNIPLEAMVMQYASLKGTLDGMDTTVITEIAEYFKRKIGYDIPDNTPFVGKNFNVTRAGIHADGLMKDERIYNVFNTKKILNRPVGVTINATSGLAGLAYWINDHYKFTGENKITKQDADVIRLKEMVDAMYVDGRQTALTDEEIEGMLTKINKERFVYVD